MEDAGVHTYFIDIWYILRPFDTFYGHLIHFTVIWYILLTFGIFCGTFVYFYPFSVYCTKKNLATLLGTDKIFIRKIPTFIFMTGKCVGHRKKVSEEEKNVWVKDVCVGLEGVGRLGVLLRQVAPRQRKRASNVTPDPAGGRPVTPSTVVNGSRDPGTDVMIF
jgi:hypothetical protein